MTIKGRSPNMRHVARTHRVDLDWLFERIREDPGISIKHLPTKQQLADILTKGSFTAEQWKHLCNLTQIGSPSQEANVNRKVREHVKPNIVSETPTICSAQRSVGHPPN